MDVGYSLHRWWESQEASRGQRGNTLAGGTKHGGVSWWGLGAQWAYPGLAGARGWVWFFLEGPPGQSGMGRNARVVLSSCPLISCSTSVGWAQPEARWPVASAPCAAGLSRVRTRMEREANSPRLVNCFQEKKKKKSDLTSWLRGKKKIHINQSPNRKNTRMKYSRKCKRIWSSQWWT